MFEIRILKISPIRLICVIALIFFASPSHTHLFGQKLIQDTLFVSFPPLVRERVSHAVVDSIIDLRDEEPRVIGMYEVNKYLFVPVDLLICTKKSLTDEIAERLRLNGHNKDPLNLRLAIDNFWLTKKTNSWIYPHYQLNASIQIYQRSPSGDFAHLGELLYETVSRKPFWGDKLKKGFEKVVANWHREFIEDLTIVSKNVRPITLENFRRGIYIGKRTHLFSGGDVVVATRGWIFDGAVFFSHREARKQFFRSGGYNLRYRNSKDFESIGFGLTIDYLFHRINSYMVFRGKSQLMFGLNRWKDIDRKDHKLYDILILDYSLSQSLIYNPLDRRGFLFGIGLQENVYYIYSKGIEFQLGLLVHLGLKL